MANLQAGLTGTAMTIVSDKNTAQTMRSGSLPVFATPSMCALMEEAACAALVGCLDPGTGSVGVSLNITHNAPTALGVEVTATALLTGIEGRKLTFAVVANDEHGIIGKGSHERFIIDNEKFMTKLAELGK
ncbi:MAG: thioesterase family protein [Phascolarctobacterium sp.]|nr:thioesterase family protein [Phascolarctobacterium sp.]MBQ7882844.1 thioesterase family protein [Phascolarctobacterium sp.]